MNTKFYLTIELFGVTSHVSNSRVDDLTPDQADREWEMGIIVLGPYYSRAAATWVESNTFFVSDEPGLEGQLHLGNLPAKKASLMEDDVEYAAKLAATVIARNKRVPANGRYNYLQRLISEIGQNGAEKELERLQAISVYQKPSLKPGRKQKPVLEDAPENFALRFMHFLDEAEYSGWGWPSSPEPSTFWDDRIAWAKVFLPLVELLSFQYEGKALLDMLGFVNWNLTYFTRFPQEAAREENQDTVLGYSY